jgi:uncharacterized membrane protein YdbT with pleckstrin-like domain
MIKEFKSSTTQFNTFLGVAIFSLVAALVVYLWLHIIIVMLLGFAVLWAALAFWGKDRVLITLHEDYIEAKEAIAAKKKLIKCKDISKVEMHKSGRLITLYIKNNEGKEKKQTIGVNAIEKSEREELFDLIEDKVRDAAI